MVAGIDLCFTAVNRECNCNFTPPYDFMSGVGSMLPVCDVVKCENDC